MSYALGSHIWGIAPRNPAQSSNRALPIWHMRSGAETCMPKKKQNTGQEQGPSSTKCLWSSIRARPVRLVRQLGSRHLLSSLSLRLECRPCSGKGLVHTRSRSSPGLLPTSYDGDGLVVLNVSSHCLILFHRRYLVHGDRLRVSPFNTWVVCVPCNNCASPAIVLLSFKFPFQGRRSFLHKTQSSFSRHSVLSDLPVP